MLSDAEIERSLSTKEFGLEPFEGDSLQPASYDLRVGASAFASSGKEILDLSKRGVLVIESGEFAVVESLETMTLGPQIAAQLGLRSEYATKGLLMLSGPQADPGFEGVLVVRLMNLAPTPVTLSYKRPFLTAQFFRLAEPVRHPYSGPRQGQSGISEHDIQELTNTEGLTLGGVMKTLGAVAADVSELSKQVNRVRGSLDRLTWSIPIIVLFGIAVIAILVGLKG